MQKNFLVRHKKGSHGLPFLFLVPYSGFVGWLLDHVVVGYEGYTSFAERGWL